KGEREPSKSHGPAPFVVSVTLRSDRPSVAEPPADRDGQMVPRCDTTKSEEILRSQVSAGTRTGAGGRGAPARAAGTRSSLLSLFGRRDSIAHDDHSKPHLGGDRPFGRRFHMSRKAINPDKSGRTDTNGAERPWLGKQILTFRSPKPGRWTMDK